MKLLKLLNEILQETGDTTNIKTYDTTSEKKRDTVHKYAEVNAVYFNTESKTRYYIMFDKTDGEQDNNWNITVSFAAKTSGNTKFDVNAVVNKGELYKVMATVVKALNEELKESKKKRQHISQILIKPSKNFQEDTRRADLYIAYLEKNMPTGSEVTHSADKEVIKVLLPQ